MQEGIVKKVAGPLVVARGLDQSGMYEVVRVGKERLFGEIIEIRAGEYSIQVYESTEGIGPGDPVYPTGTPLSVELGPGLITSIYDGIQRPLEAIRGKFGDFIVRGAELPGLDRAKKWRFVPAVKEGAQVTAGDVLGTVDETPLVKHKIMVPPGLSGRVASIREAEATVTEPVCVLETAGGRRELTMMQRWPVRQARPVARRVPPVEPLITGQRVIDALFPVAKGGTACVPGPFGSGKTVVQHQLAKWANAEIIVYVGCGERGNEMTDVLLEFPELRDPDSGRPLIERTVLIANTSNMPVAAREASVFCGITIAEYFRDMGYSVATMADSTSRWAEAMREISGRLEEMPGEEGFPAYLASRIAGFYERAGNVVCLGADGRTGNVSLIGAVSPPGGDLSEPVVQATLRVVKVFWGLDDALAAQRHFPAINWLTSYSLYDEMASAHAKEHVDARWPEVRRRAMWLLNREAELEELVRLVGMDALSPSDRLILQGAKMVREDFLHQSAFDPTDTYTSQRKQFLMLRNIVDFYDLAHGAMERGVEVDAIQKLPLLDAIAGMKRVDEDELAQLDTLHADIEKQVNGLAAAGAKEG
ncbi:MAG: V-type ATP synthase subunit A [Planctomycetes bacterium]|nr:V-type ATP synthase subunit A [Planctomycetota bacterium]